MFSCSPVVTLRSTKNWVHIPLKEISDANKLFCARCSGYRVAPKTKLWVTLLTSAKFPFLLPGRHRARRDGSAGSPLAFERGAARKKKEKRGHRGGPEELQDWDWVRSLWTIQLESQFSYRRRALFELLGSGSNFCPNVWWKHKSRTLLWLFLPHRPFSRSDWKRLYTFILALP